MIAGQLDENTFRLIVEADIFKHIGEIAAFIETEYALAANPRRDRRTSDTAKVAADALFMTLLDRFSPDD